MLRTTNNREETNLRRYGDDEISNGKIKKDDRKVKKLMRPKKPNRIIKKPAFFTSKAKLAFS